MARLVGIDIRSTHVRAALVRATYRGATIEAVQEIDRAGIEVLEQAIRLAAEPFLAQAEGIAVSLGGDQCFIHRVKLPATAAAELDQVLAYELEGLVPVDVDDLVYDYRTVGRVGESLLLLTASARKGEVQACVEVIDRAIGREPDRVAPGPLPLANLAAVNPALVSDRPIAIVDLGEDRSEVVILLSGEATFARTVSRGVAGLPASAPLLAGALRQTFAAWAAQGDEEVSEIVLVGGGADAPGAEEFLSHELGIPARRLAPWPGASPAGALPGSLHRYAKAIGLALGLRARPRDLDLRGGESGFQRSVGFLRDRWPVLAGLSTAVLLSFLFSAWAEARVLEDRQATLATTLASLSKSVLGEQTDDPDVARELLDKGGAQGETDPLPHADAFDFLVEFSKAVPDNVTHDVEELDIQRGHVTIRGLVSSTAEAQTIADNVKKHPCFSEVKISKVTQAVNSDRQKYVLELDIRCPEDHPGKDKDKDKAAK